VAALSWVEVVAGEAVIMESLSYLEELLHKHPRSKPPTCREFKASDLNTDSDRGQLCRSSYQRVVTSPQFEVQAVEDLQALLA
jgi:hypothetical protein